MGESVLAVTKTADGRNFILGVFSAVAGTPRPGLAALHNDGSIDASFAPSAGFTWSPDDGRVRRFGQLAVAGDGSIYVLGSFTAAGSLSVAGIARYLPDGTLDTSFVPVFSTGGTASAVTTLPDGRVAVGGSFASVNGQARINLAAFGPGGVLDPVFGTSAGPDGPVAKLAPKASGGCFLGGSFHSVGSVPTAFLGALNADGSANSAFRCSALTDAPFDLAGTPDSKVVASAGALTRFNENGQADLTYTLPQYQLLYQTVYANSVACDSKGNIYADVHESYSIGGGTDDAGDYITEFSPDGQAIRAFPSLTFSDYNAIHALAAEGNSVVVTGSFPAINDRYLRLNTGQQAWGLAMTQPTSATIANFSLLGTLTPGGMPLIAGITVGGHSAPLPGAEYWFALVRGVGPQLQQSFGVSNALPDPLLTWYTSNPSSLVTTAGWRPELASVMASLGAFPLAPGSRDAAAGASFVAGSQTIGLSSATGSGGTALFELYDYDHSESGLRLTNLSGRALTGGAAGTFTAGIVIAGTTTKTLLVRAVGPGLSAFGLAGVATNAYLAIKDGNGADIPVTEPAPPGEMASLGAFPLTRGDSAVLVDLAPGAYTFQIGTGGQTPGQVLFEVYEVL